MNADIKGALEQLNRSYHTFEHNGKRMTKEQVKAVLEYGLEKGYTHTGQLTDNEVDLILSTDNKIEYICDDCGTIIDESESNMFGGKCEECNLDEHN